jgi:hypothetical protein
MTGIAGLTRPEMGLYGALDEGEDGRPEILCYESGGQWMPMLCQAASLEAAGRQFASKLGKQRIWARIVKFDRASSESFEGLAGYEVSVHSDTPFDDRLLLDMLRSFIHKIEARGKAPVLARSS